MKRRYSGGAVSHPGGPIGAAAYSRYSLSMGRPEGFWRRKYSRECGAGMF